MQSLNDSVDELKSRIAKLEKSVQDLQSQLQNVQPQQQGAPGMPAGSAPTPESPGPGADEFCSAREPDAAARADLPGRGERLQRGEVFAGRERISET